MPWPDPLAPLDRQSIRRQFPRAPSTNLGPEPADRDFGTAIRYPWLTILIPGCISAPNRDPTPNVG